LNRIRHFRQKAGLTQRQLAALSGTSQQQIHRIEAGVQSARLELAARLCSALNQNVEVVFPGTKKPLEKFRTAVKAGTHTRFDDHSTAVMEKAGLDVEPEVWFLKVWLRSHTNAEIFPISGIEQKRLWSLLQEEKAFGFAIFDSEGERIAINPRHLLVWQLLWESSLGVRNSHEQKFAGLVVLLSDRTEPLEFEIGEDDAEFGPEENEGRGTQFQRLFVDLETWDLESDNVVSFEDNDGEEVFLRTSDVKLLRVPLSAVEPKLAEAEIADPEFPDDIEDEKGSD
jgi:transcriptional regulator with XRE-family HTH domain